MTVHEYEELKALSRIEPVGSDALIYQMAMVVSSLANVSIDKAVVLSTFTVMTPEQIKAMFDTLPKIDNGNSSGS